MSDKSNNFVLELPLIVEKWQEDKLNTTFEIGRNIYNSLVNITSKRYNQMIRTKLYKFSKTKYIDFSIKLGIEEKKEKPNRLLLKQLRISKNKYKSILSDLRIKYNISLYAFEKDVKDMQKHFKNNINSHLAQKICFNLWKAYEKLMFGDGNEVHFKKFGSFNSLEGKNNKTGLVVENEVLKINKMKLPIIIDKKNYFEVMCFDNKICYNRIIRKKIRGKYKFYVQIIFEGVPPIKIHSKTGEVKTSLGKGTMGADIGTQTLALSSSERVSMIVLADKVNFMEREIKLIQRKMDRSRRTTNPNNYNVDGTIKKQGNKKVNWFNSNRYSKLRDKLAEVRRKQAAIRKYQHECLANEIIKGCDTFIVETMNYKALQKKAKKTTVSMKTGKINRKKRFGKSLGNRSPATFLATLKRKIEYHGGTYSEVNTWSFKASQYNHSSDEYKKKSLSKRFEIVDRFKVQRDLYSAFLLMNTKDDLKTTDKTKCDSTFEEFIKLHNLEWKRLEGNKNISSIGI